MKLKERCKTSNQMLKNENGFLCGDFYNFLTFVLFFVDHQPSNPFFQICFLNEKFSRMHENPVRLHLIIRNIHCPIFGRSGHPSKKKSFTWKTRLHPIFQRFFALSSACFIHWKILWNTWSQLLSQKPATKVKSSQIMWKK
jgi:hypothetical protein